MGDLLSFTRQKCLNLKWLKVVAFFSAWRYGSSVEYLRVQLCRLMAIHCNLEGKRGKMILATQEGGKMVMAWHSQFTDCCHALL